MKVIITSAEANDYGEGEAYTIKTPKNEISFGHMEPEDANLCRDLNCVYSIPTMLQEAYDAGKAGEPLEFENRDAEEE